MSAQANLKSTGITNLDASPVVRPSAGAYGPGRSQTLTAVAGPTTDGATTGGILRMCRVPSNCYVKEVMVCQKAATTTAAFDVGAYYSDATNDGTQASLQGTAIASSAFATALDTHALVQWTSTTFKSGGYAIDKVDQPLWQALGLSSDPGGMIDIALTNSATISGAATLGMKVTFVVPG